MDKLERHIKESLEERRIDPSPGSWDRLAQRLPSPAPTQGFAWKPYALAACFVGVMVLALGSLIKEEPQEVKIQVVEHNGEGDKAVDRQIAVPDRNDFWERGVDPGHKEGGIVANDSSGTRVLDRGPSKGREVLAAQDLDLPQEPDGRILQKVEEVVAQVEHLERVQNEVSDREVDSLLRLAQQQILRDRLFQKSGGVDALALLAEVEEELDASFRDRLYEALKAGYLKLRTAVADRNN